MGSLRQSILRDAARDRSFALFLVTLVLCLFRAADQPGFDVGLGGTSLTFVPADAALGALAVAVALRLLGRRAYPRAASALTVAALVLAGLIVLSAVGNGSTALVAAAKLAELAALLVGWVVLVDSVERLWAVLGVFVLVTVGAVLWAIVGFAQEPGDRQASFLGEHDLAAVSTAALVLGLAALHGRHRLGRLPLVAGVAGGIGITLGASLASLLGLYLAAAALIATAAARKSLRGRSVLATALVALAVTGGTYGLRSDDLGFLRQWFAPVENAQPGEYAGSWSQRLIFAYIGGRVFLDRPVLGTGWWGELPPSEYARYLPDARARFPDQPERYFPPAEGTLIPQQTYDQILFQLGLVGALSFGAVALLAIRDAARTASRWPRPDDDELAGYLPAGWLAALAGALAGSALFGGTPMAALLWLTLGLVGAASAITAGRRPAVKAR
jgi:hypothetical protein